MNIRFLVPEQMYLQALTLVKNNELHYVELSKSMVEQHVDRLSKLNEFSKNFKDQGEQCCDIERLGKEIKIMDSKLEKILQFLEKK